MYTALADTCVIPPSASWLKLTSKGASTVPVAAVSSRWPSGGDIEDEQGAALDKLADEDEDDTEEKFEPEEEEEDDEDKAKFNAKAEDEVDGINEDEADAKGAD